MKVLSPRLFLPLTRRQVTRLALSSAASLLLMNQTNAQTPVPLPTPPASTPPPAPTPEGEALLSAVPANVGYALSATQTAEVRKQLQSYPGDFAKARAYALPDDVGPAFAPLAPPLTERKKRAR